MNRKFYSIELNSNSWHVWEWVETFRYRDDSEESQSFLLVAERDLQLGSLEAFIVEVGFNNLMPLEDAKCLENAINQRECAR